MSDERILEIIQKYSHGESHVEKVKVAKAEIDKVIAKWAGDYLLSSNTSGSFAKGTATTLGSDFDIFISLSSDLNMTLKAIYNSLFEALTQAGYAPRRQNVSLGLVVNRLNVDVTPARKHSGNTNDHSIYLYKKDSWTQTNITIHVNMVKNSRRLNEIRITKIWSKLHSLEFSSFYLELAVIEACKGRSTEQLDLNFQEVLRYLATDFITKKFEDPANSNNLISDSLTATEKAIIAIEAKKGYEAPDWSTVIW